MFTTVAALLRVLSVVAGGAGYIKEDVQDALDFGANLLMVGAEGKAELEALVAKWEGLVERGETLTDQERVAQRARSAELSMTLQSLATDVPEPELGSAGAAPDPAADEGGDEAGEAEPDPSASTQ